MADRKPVVNKGIIIYDDYESLFSMLSDTQLGRVIRLLQSNHKLVNPIYNPVKDKRINAVYNYIVGRIVSYQNTKYLYEEFGRKGHVIKLDPEGDLGDNPEVPPGQPAPPTQPKPTHPKKKPNIDTETYQSLMEFWNNFARENNLTEIKTLSKTRKESLELRVLDAGGVDEWKNAVARMQNSQFLMGKEKDSRWRADFDFTLKAGHFLKIMEGGYEKGTHKSVLEGWKVEQEENNGK